MNTEEIILQEFLVICTLVQVVWAKEREEYEDSGGGSGVGRGLLVEESSKEGREEKTQLLLPKFIPEFTPLSESECHGGAADGTLKVVAAMFSHENVSGMYGLSAAVIGGEDRHVQAALWSEGFLSQY